MMATGGGTLDDEKRILDVSAPAVSPTRGSNAGVKLEYFCEICKSSCRNEEIVISRHNEGAKHLKKAAGQQVLLRLSQEYDCFEHDLANGIFHCVICKTVLNSPKLLESHLLGAKHKKQKEAREKEARAAKAGEVEYSVVADADKPIVAAAPTAAESEVVNDGYWCEICNYKLVGKTTLQIINSHTEGLKHKRKLANYEILQKLRQQEDCFTQDPVSGVLKCLVCCLETATPQQMMGHLAGAKHRNKARRHAREAEAAEREEGEIATDAGYWCEICKLSGDHTPLSVANHMQGTKHQKKVAANELLQKLKETTDCFDHNEETGILKCRVCNLDVNTPQLLEAHLRGSKHILRVEGRPGKRKHEGDPNHTLAKRVAPNPKDPERTLILKNIAFKAKEKEIREVFGDCGDIENLYCIKDFKGRSQGLWHLLFRDREAAYRALEKDESFLRGRPIYVSPYSPVERMDYKRSGNPEKEKLFVSDHPKKMSEEEIRNLSAPHGEIKDLKMLMKKWSCAYYKQSY